MGLAPQPGIGKQREEIAAAKSMLFIEYDGERLSLAWRNLPMGERIACRKATGLPFESFSTMLGEAGASTIGEDSLCVTWWLARRAHGDALTFEQAVTEWDVTKVGTITVDTPDMGSDDPEA